MMDEQQAINDAFQDNIRDLYNTLTMGIEMAKGDAQLEADAKAKFVSGMVFARRVYAMASEVIGKPAATTGAQST
ncbi:hypothetical protein [Dyella silvae]|uniref:hypothetical protein n=1 Tax=Dyella silvae TaxID=2994424 RepID=UPI002263F11F|nr:hypothetical protein [Dyella silvae]